jgi:hypothetical protein
MKNLPIEQRELSEFMWKDRNNRFHAPAQMETSYLYKTLKMIWNHSMPEEFKLMPYKLYAFGPFYTPAYMRQAAKAFVRELEHRKSDMTFVMCRELQYMGEVLWALDHKKIIEHVLLKEEKA